MWTKVDEVDRSKRELAGGRPIPADESHRKIDPFTGLQKDYVVLTVEERHKGYVRPVRRTYRHTTCNTNTTMSQSIAETYARDPGFYTGTYCVQCKGHFSVGADGDFVWLDDGSKVGS
jgi:hypothetical protein